MKSAEALLFLFLRFFLQEDLDFTENLKLQLFSERIKSNTQVNNLNKLFSKRLPRKHKDVSYGRNPRMLAMFPLSRYKGITAGVKWRPLAYVWTWLFLAEVVPWLRTLWLRAQIQEIRSQGKWLWCLRPFRFYLPWNISVFSHVLSTREALPHCGPNSVEPRLMHWSFSNRESQ